MPPSRLATPASWPSLPTWGFSGVTARTPQEQTALACRILENRHLNDLLAEAGKQLGIDGRAQMGPIDQTRNPMRDFVGRVGRAYQRPPAVSGLPAEVVDALGTAAASTLRDRYAEIDAVPMPTSAIPALTGALRYRLGAVYAGVLIGETRAEDGAIDALWLQAVAPCDLQVLYASDDPREPTVIWHRRRRLDSSGQMVDAEDVYDLSDPRRPVYVSRAVQGGATMTGPTGPIKYVGDAYPWRRPDGRPYHRIVIQGDPRSPYDTAQLVDGSLSVSVLWSWWKAGIRDASYPQRSAIGLELDHQGSDDGTGSGVGATGALAAPSTVLRWRQAHPDVPGMLHQWGPGFDPEITGRAVRDYEHQLLASNGLPMSMEGTGGDPAALEEQHLADRIRSTLDETRRSDAAVLTRCAWMLGLSPGPIGILYLDEIEDALERADESKAAAAAQPITPAAGAGQGPAADHEEEYDDDPPTAG